MSNNPFGLAGRVAVVMGGPSGLGRAIAIGLAEAGADVVPTGRRENLVDEVCSEIERGGRRTVRHAADVLDRSKIDAFRDAVLAAFGRADILVNAAARTFRNPTKDVGEQASSASLDTNLTGMLHPCQSFYRPLRTSRH